MGGWRDFAHHSASLKTLSGEALNGGRITAAESALRTIERALSLLEVFSWSCRESSAIVIPFGTRGYVALFEIEGDDVVTILAVRHQRESDYR